MKKIIYMLFVVCNLFIAQIYADTVIGKRCYRIEPANAPADNATEYVWVVEKGAVGSGIFDFVGYHKDAAGLRTPINGTSYRVYDAFGLATYDRYSYGALGQVAQEISYANSLGNVQAMYNMSAHSDIFYSHSVLHDDGFGGTTGTFRVDDWNHSITGTVQHLTPVSATVGFGIQPGIIYSITCSGY
jgi:hypothetical protein